MEPLDQLIRKSEQALPVALLADTSGQATVEYILIVALVVLGASQLGQKIMGSLDLAVLRIGADLERDLKTGRAPLDVWSN